MEYSMFTVVIIYSVVSLEFVVHVINYSADPLADFCGGPLAAPNLMQVRTLNA